MQQNGTFSSRLRAKIETSAGMDGVEISVSKRLIRTAINETLRIHENRIGRATRITRTRGPFLCLRPCVVVAPRHRLNAWYSPDVFSVLDGHNRTAGIRPGVTYINGRTRVHLRRQKRATGLETVGCCSNDLAAAMQRNGERNKNTARWSSKRLAGPASGTQRRSFRGPGPIVVFAASSTARSRVYIVVRVK